MMIESTMMNDHGFRVHQWYSLNIFIQLFRPFLAVAMWQVKTPPIFVESALSLLYHICGILPMNAVYNAKLYTLVWLIYLQCHDNVLLTCSPNKRTLSVELESKLLSLGVVSCVKASQVFDVSVHFKSMLEVDHWHRVRQFKDLRISFNLSPSPVGATIYWGFMIKLWSCQPTWCHFKVKQEVVETIAFVN